MRVLIACEFSGIVRNAFRHFGHDAWSCDLLPSEDHGKHMMADALRIANEKTWDLMIAHPPCTYMANSGVRWLYDGKGKVLVKRWDAMITATLFFRALLEAPIEKIAIENPVIHGHAKKYIGRHYDQIIHPWQFGHGETKATCLWLKNLPKLKPTKIVDGRHPRVHFASPGPDRWKERSRTLTGIAQAMATQWGNLHENPP
jgi:hypothetical protein